MNTNYKLFRKLCVCLAVICLCMTGTGCKQKPDENGSLKAEDGRSYGGTIKAKMGEKVQTAFFDLTVESAKKSGTFQFEDGLYQANEGQTYLVVNVTIKNTYEKDLPMSIGDFTLNYKGKEKDSVITGYGKADLNQDDFMENIFTLKKGESITKSILFTVDDKDKYTLCYSEYYEDKFEGDNYEVSITPEVIENAAQNAAGDASTETPDTSSEAASTETTETEAASTEAAVTEAPETEAASTEATPQE